MWNTLQSTQEEQSSNGMLLLGTAGRENILGKYLFNIVLDQKEKEALFFTIDQHMKDRHLTIYKCLNTIYHCGI